MDNTKDAITETRLFVEMSEDELRSVSGGAMAAKKGKCPKCGQMTLVIKFKKFKCINPACNFEQNM